MSKTLINVDREAHHSEINWTTKIKQFFTGCADSESYFFTTSTEKTLNHYFLFVKKL